MDKKKLFNFSQYEIRRKELRKNQTEPEKRFWQAARGKQLGVKFRRQQGIGHYIVDFYCAEQALVIELDGDSHFSDEGKAYDLERDNFLRAKGLRVLRFTNQQVMKELEAVLAVVIDPTLASALPEKQDPTLALPLSGEGINNSSPSLGGGTKNSSPCEGGGREGVILTARAMGSEGVK